MRTPGTEPGSQAWEACMIRLHYVRCWRSFLNMHTGNEVNANEMLCTWLQWKYSNQLQHCRKTPFLGWCWTMLVSFTLASRGVLNVTPALRCVWKQNYMFNNFEHFLHWPHIRAVKGKLSHKALGTTHRGPLKQCRCISLMELRM